MTALFESTLPQVGGDAASLTTRFLNAALDEIDTGIVICDGSGEVVFLNEAARGELAQGGVLALDARRQLVLNDAEQLARLHRATLAAVHGRRRELLKLRDGARSLTVGVQPLGIGGAAQPMVLLLLSRRQLAPGLAVEMLAAQHDLTYAERRIFMGILDGLGISALARANDVTVSTVRTQVAALRAKFDVRRAHDLVRLVARLPPMTSALRQRA